MSVAGLILAGGRASRMGGGDKALLPFSGHTLLDQIIARLSPQVGRLLVSANGDPARFARFGLTILADPVPGHAGPLAGVLAGLLECRAAGLADRLVTVACDTPFLPADLVARLEDGPGEEIAIARSGGRAHPVVAAWPTALAPSLAAALGRGEAGAMAFVAARPHRFVDFAIGADGDPFFNVNTPADLAEAEHRAGSRP